MASRSRFMPRCADCGGPADGWYRDPKPGPRSVPLCIACLERHLHGLPGQQQPEDVHPWIVVASFVALGALCLLVWILATQFVSAGVHP